MRILLSVFILVVVGANNLFAAIQFDPKFWESYTERLSKVNGFAVELDEDLKKGDLEKGERKNSHGVIAALQILTTYVRTDYKDKKRLQGEIDKAIKTNLLLNNIESQLSELVVSCMASDNMKAQDRQRLAKRYNALKAIIKDLNNDCNTYLSKLVELLQ